MATATKTKTLKSFNLSCPHCGTSEAITLDLNDLRKVTCGECSEEMDPRAARDMVADQLRRWDAMVAWLDVAGEMMAEAE